MNREERRRDERRSLTGETVVMTYPHQVVSDTLVDLSRGGLAFLYSSANPLPSKDLHLNIIREDIFIEDVPVSIVNDQPSVSMPFSRRCGVRFGPLNAKLKEMIDNLFEGAD